MDNMMNLELIYWAAENGGGQQLKELATRHAETTVAYPVTVYVFQGEEC
jgi:unsaturated chondroitin disaccharide hydrolase